MGRKTSQIIGVDVNDLIKIMNFALSERWLAFYQYWIGAGLMISPMCAEVEPELLLYAN